MLPPTPAIGVAAVRLEDGAALLTVGEITIWLTARAARHLVRLTALPLVGDSLSTHYTDTLDADSGWTAEALLHRDTSGCWHVLAAAEDEIVAAQIDGAALAVMLIGGAP
jgi:hypothetical protein